MLYSRFNISKFLINQGNYSCGSFVLRTLVPISPIRGVSGVLQLKEYVREIVKDLLHQIEIIFNTDIIKDGGLVQ